MLYHVNAELTRYATERAAIKLNAAATGANTLTPTTLL
jgi:hypothetical protein